MPPTRDRSGRATILLFAQNVVGVTRQNAQTRNPCSLGRGGWGDLHFVGAMLVSKYHKPFALRHLMTYSARVCHSSIDSSGNSVCIGCSCTIDSIAFCRNNHASRKDVVKSACFSWLVLGVTAPWSWSAGPDLLSLSTLWCPRPSTLLLIYIRSEWVLRFRFALLYIVATDP